jgi:orotate phosphoribosyltransferase
MPRRLSRLRSFSRTAPKRRSGDDVEVFLTTVIGVVALVVAIMTYYINIRAYRLQKAAVDGEPGRKVEKVAAMEVLGDEIGDEILRRIAADHIFIQCEKTGVGYVDCQPLAVYLDLHSAACKPAHRQVLAHALADFATDRLGAGLDRVSIASPREGNIIVGSAVADRLGLNFLMIRTGRAPRFGYPIEGVFLPGTSVVLLDDLCMEASFLSVCAQSLRSYGLNISHCVCLFERLDGDAREGLAAVGVQLHAKYQIDDETLKELKQSGVLVPRPMQSIDTEQSRSDEHRGDTEHHG